MKGISFILFLLLTSCASKDKQISEHPIKGPLAARYESCRQCYLESYSYQGRNLPPSGKMVVSFTISKEGKVEDERIKENTFPKDPNFQACVLDQFRKISFPLVKAETKVEQLINFLPVEL
jgi:outer membrane biosynthesis protein TonB